MPDVGFTDKLDTHLTEFMDTYEKFLKTPALQHYSNVFEKDVKWVQQKGRTYHRFPSGFVGTRLYAGLLAPVVTVYQAAISPLIGLGSFVIYPIKGFGISFSKGKFVKNSREPSYFMAMILIAIRLAVVAGWVLLCTFVFSKPVAIALSALLVAQMLYFNYQDLRKNPEDYGKGVILNSLQSCKVGIGVVKKWVHLADKAGKLKA